MVKALTIGLMVESTSAHTLTMKFKVKVFTLTLMAVNTRVSSLKVRKMAKAKCHFLTEEYTKAAGSWIKCTDKVC